MRLRSRGPEDTKRIGRELVGRLGPGSVVCLYGDLGAGKTVFVKGMAEGLGLDERDVISASFTIIAEYPTEPPLYHMDLFRISGHEEAEGTGIYDYIGGNGIAVIEWADRVDVGGDVVRVLIEITGISEREMEITGAWS